MIFSRLFDDAALFPPGNAPTDSAVPAHRAHLDATYADYVGPFIAPVGAVRTIAALTRAAAPKTPMPVSLTSTGHLQQLGETICSAMDYRDLNIVSVEVAMAESDSAAVATTLLDSAIPDNISVFLEVPRDARRADALSALAGRRIHAKFRTGGLTKAAYPDEHELAAAIHHCVRAGIAFKATAGLHHATRNTDPTTGFEQHGFLNIIAAVHGAHHGASAADLAAILASRDAYGLADTISALTPKDVALVRHTFLSFGTCSIIEPLEDLLGLGLITADVLSPSQGINL